MQPWNKGRCKWWYFSLIISYSAYFIEKHANDADGKNNPFDMDINSGRQNSYNQFASSQGFLHLTDINTFFYDYFYAGN